jgi:hypothetical protein
MPIYIKTGVVSVRKATANAVYDGKAYGYVTAAHAFREPSPSAVTTHNDDDDDLELPFDSDSDSDSDYGGVDEHDLHHDYAEDLELSAEDMSAQSTTQRSENHNSRTSHSHVLEKTSFPSHDEPLFATEAAYMAQISSNARVSTVLPEMQLLGRLSSTMTSLDCAVISVTHHDLIAYLASSWHRDRRDETRHSICVAKPRRSNIVASTSHGPVHGKLVDVPILMQVPGSTTYEHVYRFNYDGDIKSGDCGSSVSDAETNELYGLVIGKSERGGTAYMMASERIVDNLERAGSWRFLDTDYPKRKSFARQDHVPRLTIESVVSEYSRATIDRERARSSIDTSRVISSSTASSIDHPHAESIGVEPTNSGRDVFVRSVLALSDRIVPSPHDDKSTDAKVPPKLTAASVILQSFESIDAEPFNERDGERAVKYVPRF